MSFRLKSSLWVQAFLRRCELRGQYGAVLHRGAEEAGAVHVAINHLNGEYSLLSPPPGPATDELGDRRFSLATKERLTWESIRERMEKRRRVDADEWLIEVEDRNGFAGLSPLSEKDI